jgi:hypothetical protein
MKMTQKTLAPDLPALTCPSCPATSRNTTSTRGRFLRRHRQDGGFCATLDYQAYLLRKKARGEATPELLAPLGVV